MSTPPPPPGAGRVEPGSTVGPYMVLRRLAQGGQSVLFVAHEPSLEREVVLKVLPDDQATAAGRVRLMREARALAAVEHPGVVHVYGVGDQGGSPWIAMEYVRGTDLRRLLADRGPVPTTRALRWVAAAADALAAAHEAGVIHRDLKPSNVIVTHDDQIKIVDFGIAKRRAEPTPDASARRESGGPSAYVSPEQLEHGMADERSDIWALGCLLYELVVGVPPFGHSGAAATAAAILRDEPEIPPGVSVTARALISACLRKSPFARIGSAREVAALARDGLTGSLPDLPYTQSSDRLSERSRSAFGTLRSSNLPVSADGISVPRTISTRPPPPSTARGSVRSPSRASSAASMATPATASAPRERTQPPSARPSGAPRGRVKGTAIRAGLTWFASSFGQEAMEEVAARASPDLLAMLNPNDLAHGVIASGWYEIPLVGELVEHMEAVAAPDDPDQYLQQLTTAIARENVTGIYRSLFRLIATPQLLEQNAQRVWQTFFDEGTLAVASPRAGDLSFVLRGQTVHHGKLCRMTCASVQNILRAIGYTGLVMERTMCMSDGAQCCAYEGIFLT